MRHRRWSERKLERGQVDGMDQNLTKSWMSCEFLLLHWLLFHVIANRVLDVLPHDFVMRM